MGMAMAGSLAAGHPPWRRMMAKNPGVTTAVLWSLALGIGANTAIFSLLNAVVLKALPVERPEQLVQFSETYSQGDENSWIQIRRPTDDRWIRGKPLLPEAVAQHGHRLRWRSGELVVIRQDDAAGNRVHAEDGVVISGNVLI